MRISETGLHVDFPLPQQLCLIQQAHNDNRSGVNVCIKEWSAAITASNRTQLLQGSGRSSLYSPFTESSTGLAVSPSAQQLSLSQTQHGATGLWVLRTSLSQSPSNAPTCIPWAGSMAAALPHCPLSLPRTTGGSASQQGCFGQ